MKPKKILVNTLPLLSPLTGIGRYIDEVCKILASDKTLDMNFYYGYNSKHLINSSEQSNIRFFKSLFTKNEYTKKIARKILLKTNGLFSQKFDLYWEPNFIPLKNIKSNHIVTSVHDFSFELYKDFHPKERIEYFEKYFYTNIARSSSIITGSNFSKSEILNRLNFDEKDVYVIYHGIRHEIFKPRKNAKLDFVVPKKFILSTGSLEPRKNLSRLIQAYLSLPECIKKEYKLVLVGFQGWKNNKIYDLINQNKKYIYYLGYLDDITLSKLYNLATLFIFPSIYEGFGLPPLEAMACGTPVASSNASSMKEVYLDNALYFNPYDIEDIANTINIVLNDNELATTMIKNGIKHSQKFSWQSSAQQHMKIFTNNIN